MKLGTVITSVNLNPRYTSCIPYFISFWKVIMPEIDIRIYLVADEIPSELLSFSQYLYLWKPIPNINTVIQAQCLRLLIPSTFDIDNGVMITDMDMVPMSRRFLEENISSVPNNKIISLKENKDIFRKHYMMCYIVATPSIWKKLFPFDDIRSELEKICTVEHDGIHGGKGWGRDEQVLTERILSLPESDIVEILPYESRHHRLCRDDLSAMGRLLPTVINGIKNSIYTDYHMLVPADQYKHINDIIFSLLKNSI